MSHAKRLSRSADAFRQLTAITPTVFDTLLADLTPRYELAEAKRKDRPGRQRRPGAGRKHALDLPNRLLTLLSYYRSYTTHALLGFLFGVDDSAVGRNINPLQPILAGIFRIPERRVRLDPEDMRDLFFDATERGQRAYFSGKRKRHTIKNQVVTARRTKPPGPGKKPQRIRIAEVCQSSPGSVHDMKLYDWARVVGPPGAMRMGDMADIGTGLETPARKPKGGELTGARGEASRVISRRRIVVEHGIGRMKVWRVASERYRNPVRRQTLVMKDVAGSHDMIYA